MTRKNANAPKHLASVEIAPGLTVAPVTETENAPKHLAPKPVKTVRYAVLAAVFALMSAACLATAVTASADEWAGPHRFIQVSAQSAVETPGEATTYVARGRTRVNLPEEVLSDLNAWAEAVAAQQMEWYHEDQDAGLDNGQYYGGWEEGYAYCFQTLMARLGYLDGYYQDMAGIDCHNEWASSNATLETAEEAMDEADVLDLFYLWEDASFGMLVK